MRVRVADTMMRNDAGQAAPRRRRSSNSWTNSPSLGDTPDGQCSTAVVPMKSMDLAKSRLSARARRRRAGARSRARCSTMCWRPCARRGLAASRSRARRGHRRPQCRRRRRRTPRAGRGRDRTAAGDGRPALPRRRRHRRPDRGRPHRAPWSSPRPRTAAPTPCCCARRPCSQFAFATGRPSAGVPCRPGARPRASSRRSCAAPALRATSIRRTICTLSFPIIPRTGSSAMSPEIDRLCPAISTSLMREAAAMRDAAFGERVTFSKKVFIPLTHLCRDTCGYCTFVHPPQERRGGVSHARAGAGDRARRPGGRLRRGAVHPGRQARAEMEAGRRGAGGDGPRHDARLSRARWARWSSRRPACCRISIPA